MPRSTSQKDRSFRSEARSAPGVTQAVTRLGRRIRALREERGLSQEKLAALAHIDAKHLQTIERGATNTTVATLVGISRALKVELRDLFDGV